MKKQDIHISITRFNSINELADQTQKLIEMAKEATQRAWAPYSNFMVGAALLLENGEIVTANNQENVAYPSGLCAERTAIFYAGSRYPDVAVVKMALAVYTNGAFLSEPATPCGACRQVLLEYEKRGEKPMEIIMYGTDETIIIHSAEDLMPLPFNYDLKK